MARLDEQQIIALVAQSLYKSALPSVNGIHKPDRYQASVTAEDLGHTLERFGLVEKWTDFYGMAMPSPGSAETWNDIDTKQRIALENKNG